MAIGILEWIGYVASVTIAISMAMSSIVKFRLINLAGAAMFSIYGFLIGSLPVGILNGFIVAVDIYYLIGIFSKREVFEILEVRSDNKYLLRFLSFHDKEIQNFFPGFSYKPEVNTVSFFILRNMAVAGIFLAHRQPGDVLKVGLDYVVPEYRDFKNGKFVYFNLREKFVEAGFTKVVAGKSSPSHQKYLKKIGFIENNEGSFEISLVKQ